MLRSGEPSDGQVDVFARFIIAAHGTQIRTRCSGIASVRKSLRISYPIAIALNGPHGQFGIPCAQRIQSRLCARSRQRVRICAHRRARSDISAGAHRRARSDTSAGARTPQRVRTGVTSTNSRRRAEEYGTRRGASMAKLAEACPRTACPGACPKDEDARASAICPDSPSRHRGSGPRGFQRSVPDPRKRPSSVSHWGATIAESADGRSRT